MRAFLSHSSIDKGLVEKVAQLLGGANVELDSVTFEQGIINAQAIYGALKRSTMFVLFASNSSVNSPYVNYESLRAEELNARGIIDRVLIICIDDVAFAQVRESLKHYNAVRSASSVQAIARLIQHQLILASTTAQSRHQPFVGRNLEIAEAKDQLIDPARTPIRTMFVSGNAGIGRRTFVRKLYSDVFPYVRSIFPEIELGPLDGYSEIFRKLIDVNTPIMGLKDLTVLIEQFDELDQTQKSTEIAKNIGIILENKEAIFFIDKGGVLDDAGKLNDHLKRIHEIIPAFPHPVLIFITERMIPRYARDEIHGGVFCSLPTLSRDECRQLTALLLKRENVTYTNEDLENIVDVADSHPFNIGFIVQAVKQLTMPVFLSDPSELVQWKRRKGSEFLQKLHFSPEEHSILVALRDFSTLDFNTLAAVLDGNTAALGKALTRLIEFHVVEAGRDTYSISPPLRIAAERDYRFQIGNADQKKMLRTVSESFKLQAEAGQVSISLIDSAVLAELQTDDAISALFSVFLLPSHLVWLARKRYDERRYKDCIRLAKSALGSKSRLSKGGVIEACTRLALASARLGQENDFAHAISVLRSYGDDRWTRSRSAFLRGFQARLNSFFPEAEELFRESYKLSPGDFPTARELAYVCKVRGKLDDAESFARKANQIAPDNPYIIDILLSVMLNFSPAKRESFRAEIEYLFDQLKQFGDDDGHSFYTARRAELEMKRGNLIEAARLIDDAVEKTPHLFSVHALRAQIYLEQKNKAVVASEISRMQKIIDDQTGERRTGLRQLLEIKSDYLAAAGSYAEAKNVFINRVFSDEEKEQGIKAVDYDKVISVRDPR